MGNGWGGNASRPVNTGGWDPQNLAMEGSCLKFYGPSARNREEWMGGMGPAPCNRGEWETLVMTHVNVNVVDFSR